MNKGKRQSPFIGRRVPFVDNGVPILYPRYREVSEISVGGECCSSQPGRFGRHQPAAAILAGASSDKKRKAPEQEQQPAAANGNSAAAAGEQQQLSKKSKKELKKQKKQEAAAATANTASVQPENGQEDAAVAAADEAVAWEIEEDEEARALRLRREEKARKKREKQARRQAELAAEAAAKAAAGDGVSPSQQQQDGQGPEDNQTDQQQQQQQASDKGNAEEAAKIRSVLGFTSNTTTTQPAAAAAAAVPSSKLPPSSGFIFNFTSSVTSSSSAAERIAAETEAKLAAIRAVDITLTTADKDGYVPRRVFVGGMPYQYTRDQVAEYWGWCGEIESMDMLTFPDTGRFRGIVFITYVSQEGADAALQYNGEQCEGQTIKVEKCKAATVTKHIKSAVAAAGKNPRQQQEQQHRQQQTQVTDHNHHQQQAAGISSGLGSVALSKTPGYNVAYVGNIAFEASPDELRQLFHECGVTKVRLHTDRDTGKSKGYAHVHFADEAGLDRALQLNGSELHGRAIKVSPGQPKKN